jgi:hypothetical protein
MKICMCIEMTRHMNQLCSVVDYIKDQVRAREPMVFYCETRESSEVCAICMNDHLEVPLTLDLEAGESGRVNELTHLGEEMHVFCSQCDHRVHKACLQLISQEGQESEDLCDRCLFKRENPESSMMCEFCHQADGLLLNY